VAQSTDRSFPEIREAVRKLCARFLSHVATHVLDLPKSF
jgi:hypothetical protein